MGFFNIQSVAKYQKVEGGNFLFSGKKPHSAEKKLKGGTLWDFPTSILTQNSKKLKGDHLGKKFFPKKNLAVPKKIERDPLVSPGMVCYAEKLETPFGSVR